MEAEKRVGIIRKGLQQSRRVRGTKATLDTAGRDLQEWRHQHRSINTILSARFASGKIFVREGATDMTDKGINWIYRCIDHTICEVLQ
jgi:hypothetical protein